MRLRNAGQCTGGPARRLRPECRKRFDHIYGGRGNMHVNLTTTVARAAAIATVLAAGLGFAPVALATTASIAVPCDTSDLVSAIGAAPSDSTLLLAPDCTYILTSALPTITKHLGFFGND